MSDRFRKLPAVALRGMTIIPGMVIHFDVSRKKSVKAIENAMLENQQVFLVTQKEIDDENPDFNSMYKIGTLAEIKQVIKLPNNVLRVLVEGKERAELSGFEETEDMLTANIEILEEEDLFPFSPATSEAMIRNLKEIFFIYSNSNTRIPRELPVTVGSVQGLKELMDAIITNIPLYYEEKQRLLEADNIQERYELLSVILSNEVEIMRIKHEIQTKVKEKVDKNQKEYLLREQLKLIKEELGEDPSTSDADRFMAEVENLQASDEVKEKIIKEIERFKSIGPNSSESAVERGYIETLLEMPWDKASEDNEDIRNAERILNEDHYGLEKVKERVLEFLAVRILTKKGTTPIICLVGPPGTGKTSIARSIARALNKEYVRISLGGIRDEAEIRGHRKTYVGAMPGRIAVGIKSAGVKNPLMLLDEIDKVSSDYKGDTASALLEVLDSEQNVKFRDHYIEIPIDLSEVMFITTANSLQTIPKPLLDRMEIIEVTSYTENEKIHIATEHLIPKQKKKHGLEEQQLVISPKALKNIISGHTRESGVRSLEREIGELCRKAAREILEKKKKSVKITESNLEKYLGNAVFQYEAANVTDEIGIVRGLAWTSAGGDTLQIEVNVMPGKGEFRLTGQMGDVMKESAMAGISYIRSLSTEFEIPEDFFATHDIHIHIPEGAVPKDGPSAGITMATAMISAVVRKPVRADLAMTGEITLRGRVLPVGGLKEKILAAKNAGIKTVIVPKNNEKDIAEISMEIKRGIEIIYAETMKDVLPLAFAKGQDAGKKEKK